VSSHVRLTVECRDHGRHADQHQGGFEGAVQAALRRQYKVVVTDWWRARQHRTVLLSDGAGEPPVQRNVDSARAPVRTGSRIGPRTMLDTRRRSGPARCRSGMRSASRRTAISASSRASGWPTQ